MGQRLSRTAAAATTTTTTTTTASASAAVDGVNNSLINSRQGSRGNFQAAATEEQDAHHQEQEISVFSVSSSCADSDENSLNLMNNSNSLIIKIQLTKMAENNFLDNSIMSNQSQSQNHITCDATISSSGLNLNDDALSTSIANLNLNSEINNGATTTTSSSSSLVMENNNKGTAGSSSSSLVRNSSLNSNKTNNNNNQSESSSHTNNKISNNNNNNSSSSSTSNSKRLHSEARHRDEAKSRTTKSTSKSEDQTKDASNSVKKTSHRQQSKSNSATASPAISSTTTKPRDGFFRRLLDSTTASITSSSSSSSSSTNTTSSASNSKSSSSSSSSKKPENAIQQRCKSSSHKEKSSQHSKRPSSTSSSSRSHMSKAPRPVSSPEKLNAKDATHAPTTATVLTTQDQQSSAASCSSSLIVSAGPSTANSATTANHVVNITASPANIIATRNCGNHHSVVGTLENAMPICITAVSTVAGSGTNAEVTTATATTSGNQLSICTICREDLIIPITNQSPQVVLVQCSLGRLDHNNAIRLTAADLGNITQTLNSNINSTNRESQSVNVMQATGNVNASNNNTPTNAINGPIVHSQVDFVHCLVPDLDKIFNCSYYWGAINRYQAESLLEGKPEGTFLLRDSAQEEFLFSVTFRKYGRSLHARIEQLGHMFSFDCHDPSVFTAPTVTSLIQHYKDPACVMFFEPMLTIPLHRKNPFSLQELARASIVSNTSYDGISKLELPVRLKSYLKEYHYKQRVRVKPFDEVLVANPTL